LVIVALVILGWFAFQKCGGGAVVRHGGRSDVPGSSPPREQPQSNEQPAPGLRRVKVQVVYEKSRDPVAGATVGIVETSDFKSGIEPVVTDEHGVALLVGPPDGFGDYLYLLRPGEPVDPMEDRWQEELPKRATELTIETLPERTVRWKITAGAPPDGSTVRLLPGLVGEQRPTPPPTGRIEGEWLIVPGWFAGEATARAVSTEGTVAELTSEWGAEVGEETEFVQARAINVTLRTRDGAPAEGFAVVIGYYDHSSMFVRTDASGRARFEALPFTEARVSVDHSLRSEGASEWIGLVRLDGPKLDLAHTLRRPLRYTLRIVGGSGKQPSLEVREKGLLIGAPEFDPERAILRGTLIAPVGAKGLTLRIRQEVTEAVDVRVPASGDWSGTVRFAPRGELAFDVLGAPPEPETDLEIEPEGDLNVWDSVKAGELADEIVRLPVGRYRLVFGYSGLSLGTVEIKKGNRSRVLVDWSRLARLRCEVRFPDGMANREDVRVEIMGDGIDAYLSPKGGGIYEGWVLDDTRYRVWADHPDFIPHPEQGYYTGVGGNVQIALHLARGPSASFRIDPLLGAATKVKLYDDRPGNQTLQTLVPHRAGDAWTITGYLPGTYTAWFMTEKGVPWRVAFCVLKDRFMDLGMLRIRGGSRLRIVTRVDKRFLMPMFEGFLAYESRPDLSTQRFSEYDTGRWVSPLLPKGRYELGYRCGTVEWIQMVDLNGVNDRTVEIALRR
jgi:hypothetical protein